MFVTFISKKQIGVIFSNWKRGNLNITDAMIKWLYDDIAEIRGKYAQSNATLADAANGVKKAIDAIFAGDFASAEAEITRAYGYFNVHHVSADIHRLRAFVKSARENLQDAIENGASAEEIEALKAELEEDEAALAAAR